MEKKNKKKFFSKWLKSFKKGRKVSKRQDCIVLVLPFAHAKIWDLPMQFFWTPFKQKLFWTLKKL